MPTKKAPHHSKDDAKTTQKNAQHKRHPKHPKKKDDDDEIDLGEAIEEIEEIGEKVIEKTKEIEHIVEEDIEEKLQEFAKSTFMKKFESFEFIKNLLKSPCLAELLKKLGDKINNIFKFFGIVSLIAGIRGVIAIFGHWHVALEAVSILLLGIVGIFQGLGLWFSKKRTEFVLLIHILVFIILSILMLFVHHYVLFGGLGNSLWIFVILFTLLILVLKKRDMFSK